MDCSTPGFPVLPISWNLLKLMSIELVMPSNHLILCHPLLLLLSIFSSIRVFSNELALHIRWPHIGAPVSDKYSEFISFRIDWLDLILYILSSNISGSYSLFIRILILT